MHSIQLVRLEPALENAIGADPAYMEAMSQGDWSRLADLVHRVVGRTLTATPVSVDQLQWGGYFVIDARTRDVVGSCAFKTPPSEDGDVEIAYFTYPEFEGHGYATAMATQLIALARGSTAVHRVIAHTLPETSASTRVLEKAGMRRVGEVTDPDDGRVWRWELPSAT